MNAAEIAITVAEYLAPVLVAALAWGSVELTRFLRGKVKNEYLRGLLVRLNESVFTTVKDLQQRVVNKIKEARADGKLTEAEVELIKTEALDFLKSFWGQKGIGEIGKILGMGENNVENFLEKKIEAAVHDIKGPESQMVRAGPRLTPADPPSPPAG